jgi:hypothetical protein
VARKPAAAASARRLVVENGGSVDALRWLTIASACSLSALSARILVLAFIRVVIKNPCCA